MRNLVSNKRWEDPEDQRSPLHSDLFLHGHTVSIPGTSVCMEMHTETNTHTHTQRKREEREYESEVL